MELCKVASTVETISLATEQQLRVTDHDGGCIFCSILITLLGTDHGRNGSNDIVNYVRKFSDDYFLYSIRQRARLFLFTIPLFSILSQQHLNNELQGALTN